MITADQLKDVLDRTEALKRYLNIDSKLIQVEEEQLRTQAPGFWDDPKKAEAQMKKVKDLQSWIDGYKQVKALADELQLAMDFYKEEISGALMSYWLDTRFIRSLEYSRSGLSTASTIRSSRVLIMRKPASSTSSTSCER